MCSQQNSLVSDALESRGWCNPPKHPHGWSGQKSPLQEARNSFPQDFPSVCMEVIACNTENGFVSAVLCFYARQLLSKIFLVPCLEVWTFVSSMTLHSGGTS
jgi:hypothetical protein